MAQPSLLGTPGSGSTTAFDASTGNYTGFTYAVSAGSNRILILFICTGDETFTAATTVTYGGQSMTQISGYLKDNANWTTVQAWYLLESGIAAAANTTFSIDFVTTTVIDQIALGAAAFSGVNQSTPFAASATTTSSAGSTTPSTGSITASADEIVIGSMCTNDDNAFTSNNTQIFKVEGLQADSGGGAQYRTNTGALTWTTDNQGYAAAGVALAGIAAGGETITMDKWFQQAAPNKPRQAVPIASGIIGIRNT